MNLTLAAGEPNEVQFSNAGDGVDAMNDGGLGAARGGFDGAEETEFALS